MKKAVPYCIGLWTKKDQVRNVFDYGGSLPNDWWVRVRVQLTTAVGTAGIAVA